MFVTVFLGLVIAFLYFLFYLKQHHGKYKEFYKNPTPFYVPVLGNTYLFLGKNILDFLLYITGKWGKRCIGYIPHRTYFTSDPEEIKIVLNQAMDKSKEYHHLKYVFGESLLVSKASSWRKNRKILSKGFKQNILATFVPTFYEKSSIVVDILRNKAYDDIYELFAQLTLEIFLEATIGMKTSILIGKDTTFVKNMAEAEKKLFGRIGNVLKIHDIVFFNIPEGKYVKDVCIQNMYDYLKPVISQKKIDMDREVVLNTNELPLLDLLLHSADKEKFTDAFISTEIMLFASAATSTTAYSLAYFFCLLAMHPEVQQKVYEEIIEVIGDEEITADDLSKLKYTDMALNESMRLLPTIPIVARQAECDLDIGSCVIPKNTGIVIAILNLHRDENIYPDPLKFDPDRFLPENVAKRHPYSFLPFSGGPRNCIGKKYAQMSLKVTTATVLRNFVITTPYKSILELKFESSVVMNTKDPLEINFIPRKNIA